MAREAIPGLGGITNRFGPRNLPDGKAGAHTTGGSALVQYVLEFDGDLIAAADNDVLVISAGFKPLNVYFETIEVAALTGTTPTILIGTDGTEVTNGFVVSEAQGEAVGVYDVSGTLTGTWAARLAANTTVGIAIGGTGPAISGGKFKVVIEGYLA